MKRSKKTDIEILTRDSLGTIRYTSQPSYNATIDDDDVPGASHAISLPESKVWENCHTHCLDSTPGLTTWFVDSEKTLSMTFQVPTKPAQVVLNA